MGRTKFVAAVMSVLALALAASRQFYLFVVFRDAQGVPDTGGGMYHFRLAVGMTLLGCLAGGWMSFLYLRNEPASDARVP